MAEQTQAYWDDVNRYYGEILSGLPSEYDGNFLALREERSDSWPTPHSEEPAWARQIIYRFFGGLFVGTVDTLYLRQREEPEYWSSFILKLHKNEIEVQKQHVDSQSTSLTEDARHLRGLRQLRKLGLLKPSDKEYELVREELQRGANYRSMKT